MYPRAIRSSVVVLPLCAGMCRHLHTFGRFLITSNTSSGKSFGCGDVNRTRISGSTLATRSSNAANCIDPSRRVSGLYRDEKPAAYPLNAVNSLGATFPPTASNVDAFASTAASAVCFRSPPTPTPFPTPGTTVSLDRKSVAPSAPAPSSATYA